MLYRNNLKNPLLIISKRQDLPIILKTAVGNDKVMQDFDLESLITENEHCRMVKDSSIGRNSRSKSCITLSFPTAVFRIIRGLFIIFMLMSFHLDLNAADKPSPVDVKLPIVTETPKNTPILSYIPIEPKARAMDYTKAFELLRQEKSPEKISFQLSDGSTISNIVEITPMPNSTLILFRYTPPSQGVKVRIVRIEEITGVGHY